MSDFKLDTLKSLREMSLDDLTVYTGNSAPGHWQHLAGMAEFTRRQTETQIRAADAQIAAANAEVEAASAAKRAADAEVKAAEATVDSAAAMHLNAKYMLWSVVAAAFSAFGSLATTIITAVHK